MTLTGHQRQAQICLRSNRHLLSVRPATITVVEDAINLVAILEYYKGTYSP